MRATFSGSTIFRLPRLTGPVRQKTSVQLDPESVGDA